MLRFLFARLLWAVPALFGISFVTFLLIDLAPADRALLAVAQTDRGARSELRAASQRRLRERFGHVDPATGQEMRRVVLDGGLVLIGGVVWVLPGFCSGVLAVVCLLPATRSLRRRRLVGLIRRGAERFTGRLRGAAVGPVRGQVVDGGPTTAGTTVRIIEPPR